MCTGLLDVITMHIYISLVVVTLFPLCVLRVLPIRVRFSEFCGYWGGGFAVGFRVNGLVII